MIFIDDEMYWKWYNSLRPEHEFPKIDPEKITCQCGYSFKPSLFEKIRMLVNNDKYIKTCPKCQSRLKLILVEHVVCDKRNNLDKTELWRKG